VLRQKQTDLAILINLTFVFLQILVLAMANLAKHTCLGLLAANTILTDVLADTSWQDPLGFLFETNLGFIGEPKQGL
jgi:hypothetical protein